jgi:hypothetical protein
MRLRTSLLVLALTTLLLTPAAVAQTAAVDVDVNFSSAAAPLPAGFVRDHGQPHGARSGPGQGSGLTYGWVVPGTATPLDLSVGGSTPGNGRDRNRSGVAQELDTIMHAQGDDVPGFNGTAREGAWELAVPAGTYTVEVTVGDQYLDSAHTVNVEGANLVHRVVPTSAQNYRTATTTVRVTDGRVTLSPVGGTNTKFTHARVTTAPAAVSQRPAVLSAIPANQATGVRRDEGIATTLSLPTVGSGVDPATLTATSVTLTQVATGASVPISVATSGGRDTITAQPAAPLAANTTYRFTVTDAVRDPNGLAFLPFTSVFTTGTEGGTAPTGPVAFTAVDLGSSAAGQSFSSIAWGPDGKLYAATLTGELYRWTVAADGTLSARQTISTVRTGNGGAQRMIIGLAFDPAATAANPVLWVSHSTYGFGGMADWGGKVSRLSGANLGTYADRVVNLPRSTRDHLSNSLAFKNGLLYLSQGSNSAMGALDNAWGQRPERALSAAIVEIDPAAIGAAPVDVKTADGGTYDPFAPGAPVRVFGSGVRNAYDLVWHSNGSLYVPTNGSAGGGATPGTPASLPSRCGSRVNGQPYSGGSVPAIASVAATQDDYLFRVVRGGYYGHPNPSRCEWVLNGGNPTAAVDPAQVAEYPVGRGPDPNWRGAAYDFDNNKSPNGALEYTSGAFGGGLRGALLVTRYANNNDVIVLRPAADGSIASAQTGIAGFTGLADPLDLALNPGTGDLYVSEGVSSNATGRIRLLRADD